MATRSDLRAFQEKQQNRLEVVSGTIETLPCQQTEQAYLIVPTQQGGKLDQEVFILEA